MANLKMYYSIVYYCMHWTLLGLVSKPVAEPKCF